MSPLVSIIIPIYNGEKCMTAAIESAVQQTYTNLEIIVVNDGSTDNTELIANKYKENDDRVKIITKSNGGQASARNRGLAMAKGSFIQFLDCDDTLELNAIQTAIELIESESSASFVLFGFNVFSGTKLLRSPNPGSAVYFEGFGYNDYLKFGHLMASACNKFYRRSYIKAPFDEHQVFGEDSVFNSRNLDKNTTIITTDKCLYNVQLGTENSVNKRYKEGKLSDILYSREIYENKMIDLFGDEFNTDNFEARELTTLAVTIETCAAKCSFHMFQLEMLSVISNAYLKKCMQNKNKARLQDRIILTSIRNSRFRFAYILCQLYRIPRKIISCVHGR